MSGAIVRNPIQAGNVKIGSCVTMKGRPCKVNEIKTSKTGKHGSTKCNMTGVCILSGQKVIEIHPSSANLVTFVPRKVDLVAVDYDAKNDDLTLMDDAGATSEFRVNANSDPNGHLKTIREFLENPVDGQEMHVYLLTAPVETAGADDGFLDITIIDDVKTMNAK